MAIEFYEGVISSICEGNYTACVLHWRVDNTTPTDDFETATQLFIALSTGIAPFLGAFAACMGDDCFISSMRIRRVGPTGGNTAVFAFQEITWPGGFGGEITTGQVAGCLILLPAFTDGLTGRVFIPGVSESAIAEGRFTDSYRDIVLDFGDKLKVGGSIAAGTYTPVIYNRTTKTGPTVINTYLSPKAGTQRRRLVPI